MHSCIFTPPPITALVTLTPDASGAVTQALEQNRLYSVATTPALTALTLTANAEMKSSGLDFKTGSTAPTLTYTDGWKWMGTDCSSGIFSPKPSKFYRLAFEKTAFNVLCSVQEVK